MMIIHKGNLLSVNEGVILHQVNCQGVMGSGVAKAIREKYPRVYDEYKYRCSVYNSSELLGKVQIVLVSKEPQLEIVNIFGQDEYGRDGQRYTSYDALNDAFLRLSRVYTKPAVFHLPMLGCGLGGGKWPIVRVIIEQHLSNHDLNLWIQ